jgi:aldehyde dehydrogenase (NAD+)
MNVATPIEARRHPFLTNTPKQLFIDGKWLEAAFGKTFGTINPVWIKTA